MNTTITPPVSEGINAARLRQDFPVLQQMVEGKPLVYLDSATTSQKPQVVIDRLRDVYACEYARPNEGYALSRRITTAFENARTEIAETVRFDAPLRFEAGTPPFAEAIALAEGVRYWRNIGLDKIERYERDLLQCLIAGLSDIPGVEMVGTEADRVSIASFAVENRTRRRWHRAWTETPASRFAAVPLMLSL